jgi:peptidoglycan/LPS O-acetylase OafA/YrhL
MLLAFDPIDTEENARNRNRYLAMAIGFVLLGSVTILARNVTQKNILAFWYFLDGIGFYFFVKWTLIAVPQWMQSNAMVWIGRRSYSLYLYHLPIALLILHYVPSRPLGLVLAVVLSGVVSELSFRLVEDPFVQLGKRLTGNAPRPQKLPEVEVATAP